MALIGLASSGPWGMVMMAALVVLVTAVYGVLFRRTTWLRLPRKRSVAALGTGIAFLVMMGSGAAFGATHPTMETAPRPLAAVTDVSASSRPVSTPTPEPTRSGSPTPTPTATPTPTPVVTTRTVTETVAIPFTSTTAQSATAAKGTSAVTTAGVNGVETKTWTVTSTDGVETGRTLVSDDVTTAPVTQVTTVGTYVAPPAPAPAPATTCTNGTYVNSAGATVCRPEVSSSAPSGATAKCGDGTYSFSQSRRGTCSRHGGVAVWL
ncbi:DUF3761 domain-containing protein [Curtobacterium sp. MCPF17_052]|uniref:DUF3761 domain-containing protein n=1 Tax=Curtobacterium sp. MCPF17_052 TaxID=2175655 RepID=UPI0024DFD7B0|nr:DUF3761 domain-containing protein [Curtobacterium sp. MCPF17_052]WIB13612.1 DUF3761 domain-containing protein [Curtobacterium sp. MCPF17_052]